MHLVVAGVLLTASMTATSVRHVQEAAARVKSAGGLVTPILRSRWLDEQVGCALHLKAEHLQVTGSFKFRGAANAVGLLDAEEARRGVVAHSSGNHGAAVAAAAKARGDVPCTVVVPNVTPASKVANMERYGARVVLCEPTQKSRTETADAIASETGATFVHPYNDARVLAGQGTIGLELVEQLAAQDGPGLDAVLVAVSGGGMIGGIALAIKALRPDVRVIACEPAGKELQSALAARSRVPPSMQSGARSSLVDAPIDTIADAIRTRCLGPLTWDVASPLLDEVVLTVDDAMIRDAMDICLTETKQLLEPAGALTVAAALSPAFRAIVEEEGLTNVAAVLCGGNIDVADFVAQTDAASA